MRMAAERVAAAAEAAHRGDVHLVVTARAENFLHDRPDLADTVARLQRYQEAGADVLFAPGVHAGDDLRSLLAAVDRPVNVLALPGVPPVAELAKWDIGMMDEKLLKPESYKAMETEVLLKNGVGTRYGLGIEVRALNGHRELGNSRRFAGPV